ncbi:unnamed protein product [Trifolium pratense]|uniref:Uncharacterized protein n=1 Tax=Trifolium pratense TaxID=57577 RepID=A0ACB0LJK7_TRIPR|nr:unnamed protein product [Trifolium pratense]
MLTSLVKEDLPAGEKFRRGGGFPAERILVAVTRRCLVTAATISHSFLRLHGRIRLLQNSIFLQASQIWWWQAEEELAVGNIARRVLHIIREEDLSLATAAIAGLELSTVSDDEDDVERDDYPFYLLPLLQLLQEAPCARHHCKLF